MSNDVFNMIYIKNTGKDFQKIKLLLETAEHSERYEEHNSGLFNSIIPMPEGLIGFQAIASQKIEEHINSLIKSEFADIPRPEIDEEGRLYKKYQFDLSSPTDPELIKALGIEEPELTPVNAEEVIWNKKYQFLKSIANQAKIMMRCMKNVRKYGAEDWHEWRLENWGTKWDAREMETICSNKDEICVKFQTPWNWPTAVYDALAVQYPQTPMLFFSWSWESRFAKYAAYIPGKGKFSERHDLASAESSEDAFFINLTPEILELSKEFKTHLRTEF
ncbi:hypothetical protein [Polynucleobacter sp. AP-Nino-20-G2]|uniref:hypothetical protein n=1 Tax=Polynucleobacter sp. AP-Nino-20-G2 TaxID=2576917 RepID=UPI001BFE8021|nr:hypothetical protein [Polynucleobacter sp. AP-Nino-20-G2]QWE17537.1 hypothetical protein FD960_04880 [Polynucleobacter sp. AP-Nino-20-G2]